MSSLQIYHKRYTETLDKYIENKEFISNLVDAILAASNKHNEFSEEYRHSELQLHKDAADIFGDLTCKLKSLLQVAVNRNNEDADILIDSKCKFLEKFLECVKNISKRS